MKDGPHISVTEAAVAVVALVGATVATITGNISSDALVGMYGTILGYVFGRVRNGIEQKTNGGVPESREFPIQGTIKNDNPDSFHPHQVPGTEQGK